MKVKDGFWVREVGGTYVAVPLEKEARALSCIVNLNEPGALLFERLQSGADREALIAALLARYDTDTARAERAVDAYTARLEKAGLLED